MTLLDSGTLFLVLVLVLVIVIILFPLLVLVLVIVIILVPLLVLILILILISLTSLRSSPVRGAASFSSSSPAHWKLARPFDGDAEPSRTR